MYSQKCHLASEWLNEDFYSDENKFDQIHIISSQVY